MNIFNLFSKISLDSGEFNKGVKDAEDKMKKLSTGMKNMGNSLKNVGAKISSAGNSIKNMGKQASKVTAAVGAVFTGAFAKASSYIKTYESAMVVFQKSSNVGVNSAKGLFNSLVSIAQQSSFAREHLVEAGKTLVAFGFDAKKTSRYVQTITNVVAKMGGSGSDIQGLAEALAKMSNQTHIFSSDLDQLGRAGILAWDILATHFGVTKDAMQEMVSKGAVPTEKALTVITDALNETNKSSKMFQYSVAGMAAALKSGTLAGVLDSINSSLRTFSINLLGMDPTIDKGMENIQVLNGALSQFGKMLETIGTKFGFVGDWLKSSLEKITAVMGKFTDIVQNTPEDKLKSIAKAIFGVAAAGPGLTYLGKGVDIVGKSFGGLGNIMNTFVGMSGKVGSGIIKISSSLGQVSSVAVNTGKGVVGLLGKFIDFGAIGKKIESGFLGTIAGINMKMSPIIDNIKNSVMNMTSKIPEPLKQMGDKVGGIFGKIFGALPGNILPGLQNMGSNLINFGVQLLPKLLGAFNFAAIGGAVLAGLGLLNQNFGDKINEMINTAIEKGPQIIQNLADGILQNLPNLINQGADLLNKFVDVLIANLPVILDAGLNIITALAQGFADNLPTLLEKVLDLILKLSDTLIQHLPEIIKIGMQILSSLITGLAEKLPDLINAAIDLVFTLVDSLLDNIDMLVDAGIKLLISLAVGLVDAIPKLIDKIPEIIDKLVDAIVDNYPKILEAGITIIVKLAEGIIVSVPKLISKIPGIIVKIVTGFGKLAEKMWDVGKNLLEGLWNGISGWAKNLNEKIKGLCDNIVGGFKKFFGISSPSKLMRDTIGKNLAVGIGEGFQDEIKDVTRDMSNSLQLGEIPYNVSVNGKSNMGMVNGIIGAINSKEQNINVYIGGKKIASEIYDPLMNIMKNKEVYVGA